ncbi:MAG: tetratricopeptide repeat protein [Chthoniobacteraceae bacterium]|jgi:TolA-binding protein
MTPAGAFLVTIALLALPIEVIAQGDYNPAADLAKIYDAGVSAFEHGDYQTAISKLEQVAQQAGPDAKLEPLYFTLGAAYYNLQQFPKAIETLKTYQSKYPRGARYRDATFSIGQAALFIKDYDEAAAQFSRLFNVPQFREQAMYDAGYAYKEGGKPDEAIRTLETLISPEIGTAMALKGAMMLVELYGAKNESDKADELIVKILQKPQLVENLGRFDAIAVQLADSYLNNGRDAEALATYRLVRSRDEVIAFQVNRVNAIQKVLDQVLAVMRADPKNYSQYIGRINQIGSLLDDAKKVLDDARKMPNFTPALYVRMARCYYDMNRKWEAAVAYEQVIEQFPHAKERATAIYAAMVDLAELNRPDSARAMGEEYLKEFPQGTDADTVGYLMGATALQENDPQAAETYFGRMIAKRPNSTYREEMRFMMGNAKFEEGKFDDAIQIYQQYETDFPSGAHFEEAQFRAAVALVFDAKYEKAIPALEDYLNKYPSGAFASDARYRLAVCYYAASQFDDVIKRCTAWEKDYPGNEQLGEVLALEADSLAAKGDNSGATDTYIRSYKAATTDEVLTYSLFEAQKYLQRAGDWTRMSDMFQDFVNNHPDHAAVPMAMYWVGKAKAHDGKLDEAKQYIAANIKKYINDPNKEGVEQLLTLLAQLCAHRPPPPAPVTTGTGATVSGTTIAEATPTPAPVVDPDTELKTLLSGDASGNETSKARILFARSEMARLKRKPADQDALIGQIAQFKPEDLSPTLLAVSGDYLLAKGETDRAALMYQHLMDTYPKSTVLDSAYNGLGQIALRKNDNERALSLFTEAIDEVGAVQKLKDVTIGKAKALLALGRLTEAQSVFEQVASMREWRGEAAALAVYSLGEIQFKQSNWAEANAYFQRVYVAYQRFLPWVAKSYLMSGDCFQKLGKTPEAVRTYQEMLRNDKLAGFQETDEARKQLALLAGGGRG